MSNCPLHLSYYFFTHHSGTDPAGGFFRSEGRPFFLVNLIILLLVDRLLSYLSSKEWKISEALVLLQEGASQ